MSEFSDSSLQSDLGAVRGLGSAKSGTKHWIYQRITAVALIFLGIWMMGSILALINSGMEYNTVVDWVAAPFNSVMLLLFTTTMLYHAKLGLQVVIEDYVHRPVVKYASITMLYLVAFGGILASAYAIIALSLGA